MILLCEAMSSTKEVNPPIVGGSDPNSFLEMLREVKDAKLLPKLVGRVVILFSERFKIKSSFPNFVLSSHKPAGNVVKRFDDR